jgi:hypothetical protein
MTRYIYKHEKTLSLYDYRPGTAAIVSFLQLLGVSQDKPPMLA